MDRRNFIKLGGGVALTPAALSLLSAFDGARALGAPRAAKGAEALRPVTLGFIALTDCASLVMAKELGYFEDRGLDVTLVKQASWPATRDALLTGQIDGAHCLFGMPFSVATGIGGTAGNTSLKIAMVLNNNGQAITLKKDYAAAGYANLAKARKVLEAKTPTMAMTFPGGTHDMWIRYWLAAGGIDPDKDISTIVVPPPQMVANMKVGNMDAFCVGEPWGDQLVHQDIGFSACMTGEIWKDHPEKSLGMRADWVDKNPKAAMAVLMAVMEAQQWCEKMENKEELATIIGKRQWLNVPPTDINARIKGDIDYGDGRKVTGSDQLMKFWKGGVSYPYQSHELWFLTENQRWGKLPRALDRMGLVRRVNRSDIWRQGAALAGVPAGQIPQGESRGIEKFFDGKLFDPAKPEAYLASLAIKR
jgi:nitrate/nitrite transport system substrate-binding protein